MPQPIKSRDFFGKPHPATNTLDNYFGKKPTTEVVVLIDSDSSDDELVDANVLLKTPVNNSDRGRDGLRPRNALQSPTIFGIKTPPRDQSIQSPYRNDMKSLIRASAKKKKYDLSFLDNHVEQMSSDEEFGDPLAEGGDGIADIKSALQSTSSQLSEEDVERVRMQLGTSKEAAKHVVQLCLFSDPVSSTTINDDIDLSEDSPVERILKESRDIGSIIMSGWLEAAQARLTQGLGDLLMRLLCTERDECVWRRAWDILYMFQHRQMSDWHLTLADLTSFTSMLQGTLQNKAIAVVAAKSKEGITGSPRLPLLLDIASIALDSDLNTEDKCQVVTLYIASILDYRNRTYSSQIQKSLVKYINRVRRHSEWSLIASRCIAQLGNQCCDLDMSAQLFVVESIPATILRSAILRRGLAFLFLKLQQPESNNNNNNSNSNSSSSARKIATAPVLPGQIVLRIVSEILETSSIFKIQRGTSSDIDYGQLEASIGLLANVLDNVREMWDVRDVARSIHQQLNDMNAKINDGMANDIAKTLAKDAIQTLLVRIYMTVISDSTQRLDPIYQQQNTLDGWLSKE